MTDYPTTLLKQYLDDHEIRAMDLIRACDIAVTTAYRISRGEPMKTLDTFYKVYLGLKAAGYELTWEQITGIK